MDIRGIHICQGKLIMQIIIIIYYKWDVWIENTEKRSVMGFEIKLQGIPFFIFSIYLVIKQKKATGCCACQNFRRIVIVVIHYKGVNNLAKSQGCIYIRQLLNYETMRLCQGEH